MSSNAVEELSEEEKKIAHTQAIMQKAQENSLRLDFGPDSAVPDLAAPLPENVLELATLDPIPQHVAERTVRLVPGERAVTTNGMNQARGWFLKWENDQKWTNPLTGWTSSADPMTTVTLSFNTKEEGLRFAEKRGYKVEVTERELPKRQYGTNYYAHNFLPEKLEKTLRSEGVHTKHFAQPTAHQSHYFRPLKFHGDGRSRQHGANQNAPIAPDASP